MKMFLSIISIIAASTLHAQTYQTFLCNGPSPTRHLDIPVAAGEILEVVGFWIGGSSATIKIGDAEFGISGTVPQTFNHTVVAGPLTVSVDCPVGNALIFTYKLTTIANVASQAANAQAVEIPAATIAPVDVILEKSDDLLTWTAALPGNYPVAPAKRFFRVRTVLH